MTGISKGEKKILTRAISHAKYMYTHTYKACEIDEVNVTSNEYCENSHCLACEIFSYLNDDL